MTRSRCWFILIISLSILHRNGFSSPFIIPLLIDETNTEIDNVGNGTVSSNSFKQYEESATESSSTEYITTEKSLSNVGLFLNASTTEIASTEYYPIENISTDDTITAYTTVPFIIEEPIIQTPTVNVIEEEIIQSTSSSVNATSENPNEIISTTVLSKDVEFTTASTAAELVLETSITIKNDMNDSNIENSIENPIKNRTEQFEASTQVSISRTESSTATFIDLYPSTEDFITEDSIVWYTVMPLTNRTFTEQSTIDYSPTPYIGEYSTYNSIAREYTSIHQSDEMTSTTPRKWYIVDSSGVRPYIEDTTHLEQTTYLPTTITTTTTTENPALKTTYCFNSDGLNPVKYCISGCNFNNEYTTKNQFGNCIITRNCQPTCYYVNGIDSNNINPRCFNIKTDKTNVQPICCYKQNYSHQPYNQYVLPSECYEFQYSFPLSTIYFKCS
ncbi:uncharacterized protein LOC143914476 [Arctopsyche grandis]|uniref:uncharacterized protein LOC143914476 n=1 Tax=Arctopsyche grandis TaxID=121162 RepID=UPI00406D7589